MRPCVWVVPLFSISLSRPVTLHKDIDPLSQRNCQSCHRSGQLGPASLQLLIGPRGIETTGFKGAK